MSGQADSQAYHTLAGAFRAPVQRRPLPVRERVLLWLLGILLVFSTFAIGLRDVWALSVALAVSILAFLLGVSRPGDRRSPDPRAHRSGRHHLLRFPIFWMGLAIVAYMAIQAMNPQWAYRQNSLSWWLVRIEHIEWLPAGTRTPLGEVEGSRIPHTNAWWYVMMWSIPVLSVCAAWTGLTRRFSCQVLAWTIAGNAALVVVLGIAQRITGPENVIWWSYKVPGYAWGPFSYRNWAASFLGLSAAMTIGLALNYARERLFAARGKNPVAFVALIAIAILTGAVLTGSRAGLLWSAGLVLFAVFPAVVLYRRSDPATGMIVPVALIALLMAGVAVLAVGTLQPKGWPEAVARLFRDNDSSAMGRLVLNQVSAELLAKEPWTGVGAGGFRYHFPAIQANNDLMREHGMRHGYTFVRDVHNDWLQYMIDLGRVGAALLLAPLVWWAWFFIRMQFWRSPILLCSAAGLSLAALHAGGEFIWQNGACLLLFGLVAVTGGLWRLIEHETAARARAGG